VGVALRAAVYATLFVSLVFVLVPAFLLSRTGGAATARGPVELLGIALALAGGLASLACAVTFVRVGRGTPAPFDAPVRLVVRGPYRIVRNPMYAGAGIALLGAALYYRSSALVGYWALLFAVSHLFVTRYEEPALRRRFGGEYDASCARVGRWWPRRARRPADDTAGR